MEPAKRQEIGRFQEAARCNRPRQHNTTVRNSREPGSTSDSDDDVTPPVAETTVRVAPATRFASTGAV